MLKHREIEHHSEEYEKAEDDKEFHRVAIGAFLPVAILSISFCLRKDERLICITECLGEHHHHYRYLYVGAVDSHHRTSRLLAFFEYIVNKHLTHVLTHDTSHP